MSERGTPLPILIRIGIENALPPKNGNHLLLHAAMVGPGDSGNCPIEVIRYISYGD